MFLIIFRLNLKIKLFFNHNDECLEKQLEEKTLLIVFNF
ncbi:Hypothetical Protein SLY_1051 [Strawberry lethal yellows phytoplasma (CPA) str. NZSb11]|uniref:Uncharacterized protein n=1 Tax=Strawberry lethal yellows phytoplasma (CPA) str. NZSb11 TaxID=980422 RepID=R4RNM4_PHYAS|nr:Hypothetical Protein SLY_1051 [Strawberry lethal yellows phytoplasma (CPA) str. NZSb11]